MASTDEQSGEPAALDPTTDSLGSADTVHAAETFETSSESPQTVTEAVGTATEPPEATAEPIERAAELPETVPDPPRSPRKRATRKKVLTRAGSPSSGDRGATPEPDPLEQAQPDSGEQPGDAGPGGEDFLPWVVDDVEPDDDEDTASDLNRQYGGFGLLFKAPEPVTVAPRRTRRAPAQPVAPVATDGEPDSLSSPAGIPADGDEESAQGDASESEAKAAEASSPARRRRRRGGKGRRSRTTESGETSAAEDSGPADEDAGTDASEDDGEAPDGATPRRRTRRRRRSGSAVEGADVPGVVTKVREPRRDRDEVVGLKGSTRLEAKKQRRREGREAGRRRTIITEAEFLARRESVERAMLVRRVGDRTQIAVLEDGVLVEHYVSRDTAVSMAGNIYLGKVQNVLPSMEAAFVDIGKGRNAVLYAGEVNWDAAGLASGQPKRIENALESGQAVLVQVTKDPIGHKGARLTSQISLPGRYLVYVPDSAMTGISRKLPDTERTRLKKILRDVVPETAGVIVRTAAEGASEAELRADVERLTATWEQIRGLAENAGSARKTKGGPPVLLHGEPDLTVRVIRDVFNEDFSRLVVSGDAAWAEVSDYVQTVAPDLADRLSKWTGEEDLFAHNRVDEQIAKAMDRKVWLPSGGSLVIDRTEAMTVIDVNTGKFVGSGGNLEETVTKNNIEAAEEIVRQLRLRDIGGIIVIDFIDMVLESNRDLVVRRLLECLGRDRTKHQVAEVTSLGLVQMTRKRVGSGLIEVFSETCEHCNGRGYLIQSDPVERSATESDTSGSDRSRSRRGRSGGSDQAPTPPQPPPGGPTPAQIAAAAHAAALKSAGSASSQAAVGVSDAAGDGGVERIGESGAVPDAGAADDGAADDGRRWRCRRWRWRIGRRRLGARDRR